MAEPSEVAASGPLDPSRIVYHRGGFIYARWKAGGPGAYRHPLDVPNGLACGCVCDECGEDLVGCANDPEKIAAGAYQKTAYFSHQTNTRCSPSGERGLLEAFRLVLDAKRQLVLPEARFSSKGNEQRDVHYQDAVETEVLSVAVALRETGSPYELHVTTPKGLVRLWVVPKRLAEVAAVLAKKQELPVVLAFVQPDHDGAIYMRDVFRVVKGGADLCWMHHPEMERHAADQRLKQDAESELRRIESERRLEEMRRAMAERERQVVEESRRLGHVELRCVSCKKETVLGAASTSGEWRICGVCRRSTMFFA